MTAEDAPRLSEADRLDPRPCAPQGSAGGTNGVDQQELSPQKKHRPNWQAKEAAGEGGRCKAINAPQMGGHALGRRQ